MLVAPGLVETQLHLHKSCTMDRCAIHHGTLLEAVEQTPRAKAGFTPARHAALAGPRADAGVAVTILPATDLFLMGHGATHATPHRVASTELLRGAGVICSVAPTTCSIPDRPMATRR